MCRRYRPARSGRIGRVPAPQYSPSPRELDDLELLLSGALAPQTTFDEATGITLTLPPELADAPQVELVDPEGLPLGRWTPTSLTQLATPTYGPFRRLHLNPAQAREQYAGRLVVPVAAPLTDGDFGLVEQRAGERGVVLLALSGTGTPVDVSPVGLVRATLAAAGRLQRNGYRADVVAVPLASHGDPDLDHRLGKQVAANYATDEVLGDNERGVVVFFTGLSGSGKSTLAQALKDRILEEGRRTVTSLDGDVVRRNLSAGLTFSRADRETNIRRIGWVAAEIARHRGIAICSPIAPYDETRQQVRQLVEEAGGEFVLVHVATPLEECERRDRKGLYAKARAGEIPEFTGISSPYEEPADAAVRIDTTDRTIPEALADLLPLLPFPT
jgi:sulfate adenylyltransferase